MGNSSSVTLGEHYQFFHAATNCQWTPCVVDGSEEGDEFITVHWLDAETSALRTKVLTVGMLDNKRVFIEPSPEQRDSGAFSEVECAGWLAANGFGDLIPTIK